MVIPSASAPAAHAHLEATRLEYFDDMFKMESEANVVATLMDGLHLTVVLNQTILYPQGGGQPADRGWITSMDGTTRFRVEDGRCKGGVVYHYGFFSDEDGEDQGSFTTGQEVMVQVDQDRRQLHSRLHSAGHLLDVCMFKLAEPPLEAGKAHHFPDSPYVEYKGALPSSDLDRIRGEVEEEANRLVTAGGEVHALITNYEEAAALCRGSLPEHVPKESMPRVVEVGGMWCPCGGTHVRDISEIGKVKVPQIRVKKGTTKVSYKLEEMGTV